MAATSLSPLRKVPFLLLWSTSQNDLQRMLYRTSHVMGCMVSATRAYPRANTIEEWSFETELTSRWTSFSFERPEVAATQSNVLRAATNYSITRVPMAAPASPTSCVSTTSPAALRRRRGSEGSRRPCESRPVLNRTKEICPGRTILVRTANAASWPIISFSQFPTKCAGASYMARIAPIEARASSFLV